MVMKKKSSTSKQNFTKSLMMGDVTVALSLWVFPKNTAYYFFYSMNIVFISRFLV